MKTNSSIAPNGERRFAKRLSGAAALLAMGMIVPGQQAQAALAPTAFDDPFGGFQPLGAAELGQARGGFNVAGLDFNFSVSIETMLESPTETLRMTTQLALNEIGQLTPIDSLSQASEGAALPQINAVSGGVEMVAQGALAQIFHRFTGTSLETGGYNRSNDTVINTTTTVNVAMPGFLDKADLFNAGAMQNQISRDIAMMGATRF